MPTTTRTAANLTAGHTLKLNKNVLATVIEVHSVRDSNDLEVVTTHGRLRMPGCTLVLEGNTTPTAAAGGNEACGPEELVNLSGAASSDTDSDVLTYAWTLTAEPIGNAAALVGATTATPSITPVLEGTYTVSLTVTDAYGVASVADTMDIVVTNTAPVADAGPDQPAVVTLALVTLDGTGSSDADGDTFTYAWTMTVKPGGSAAVLAGATTSAPTFTADVDGLYTVSLIVTDEHGKPSVANTVDITATT